MGFLGGVNAEPEGKETPENEAGLVFSTATATATGIVAVAVAVTFAVTALVLTAAPMWGQHYSTRVYTENDGLASSKVYDVEQGPDGRMWFATRTGVSVFDGVVWRTFGPDSGLPSTNFFRLGIEQDGTVWAATDIAGGVYRFDGKRWAPLPRLWGRQWFAEDFNDFEVVAGTEGAIPALATSHGLFVWVGNRWWQPDSEQDRELRSIQAVGEILWVGTSSGLFRLSLAGPQSVPTSFERDPVTDLLPDPEVTSVVASADGGLWIAGRSWVGRVHDGEWQPLNLSLPGLSDVPGWTRLTPDGRSGVYVVDREMGYHVRRDGSWSYLNMSSGLASNGATAVFRGSDDVLWLAGVRGVTKIVSRRLVSYDQTHGLLDDEVTAIVELASGAMVFGHNQGLSLMRGSEVEARIRLSADPEEPLSHNRVMDLEQGPDGHVWAVTNRKGLWRFGPNSLENPRRFGPEAGLAGSLAGLGFDGEGQLWVAGKHLFRLDGDRFSKVGVPGEEDGSLMIRRLHIGDDGTLYLATVRSGLLIFGQEGWQTLVWPGQDLTLFSVFRAQDGRIWLGSSEGLFKVALGEIRPATEVNLGRPVYCLAEDSHQRLWIGTDHGLVRLHEGEVRFYGRSEGLSGNETNRDGLTIDSQGRIWIGTDLGVSRFDESFDREPVEPRPTLMAIEVGGASKPLDSPLELPWNENNLTFRFRAISFLSDDGAEYSVKLEGFDRSFLPPERALGRQISYTNLPSGEYRFMVRARVKGEPWSPPVTSELILIDRPFWKAPWFFALAVLAVALVTTAGMQHLSARRNSRLLEGQVRDRTRELEASNRRLREEISEHRQTEAELRRAKVSAEEASRAKSQFLAVMSHEIRTPMTGVLGSVELLRLSPLNGEQVQQVATLRRSGEALLAILDDILDYSRIEADRLEIEAYGFSLRRVIDDVTALFAAQAGQKGIGLRVDVDREVPEKVVGDGSRVRQIIANLVGNAVKFTDSGEVGLICRPWGERPGGVSIEIRDSGIGIPAGCLGDLFQPFHQVDSSMRRRHGGTGLGLAISRRLALAMGGDIGVGSVDGEGSVFTVTLPFEPAAPAVGDLNEPAAPSVEISSPVPLRVLVAEDNPIVQAITLEMLECLGLAADLAENGVEVLDLLKTKSYDVVLLDVQMPVLDGLETARRIVAQDGQDRPVLIAVTAHALRGHKEQCLAAGMDDYLPKPLTLDSLAEKLNLWAGRSIGVSETESHPSR